MRILLVNPSQYEVYGNVASPAYPPLGLGYLGAVLEKKHEVKILDVDADGLDLFSINDFLRKYKPEVIGISATTPTFKEALSFAEQARLVLPMAIICLGGMHPTISPEESIKPEAIDFVVRGEGEETMLELVEAIERGTSILEVKGVTHKGACGIIHNPDRKQIINLDSIPFPARHLFNQQKYTYPDALYSPCFPIMTSRGCNGKCTYCCTKQMFIGFRVRSAKNIVDEIEFLIKEHGAREIHIWDDNFTLIKSRVFEVRDEIKARGIKIKVSFPNGIRVDSVNEEVLQALKDMGTYSIAFGVESGNQEVLNDIKKGITLEQVETAFKIAKKIGLETWGFFMLGLPADTKETIKETIEFAKKLDPDIAKFHILKPYPGSEAFKQLSEKGLITESDLSKYGIHTKPVHKLSDVTEEELLAFQKQAYREFYLRPKKIVKQILRMKSMERIKLNIKAGLSILKVMK